MLRSLIGGLATVAVLLADGGRSSPLPPSDRAVSVGPLQSEIARSLRDVKPAITRLEISAMETRPLGAGHAGNLTVVHLWGPGTGTAPLGRAEEIFAVLWIDSTLSRVLGVVDTFPAPRRDDYGVWLHAPEAPGTVMLCGEGDSYGDGRMRRRIWLNASGLHADSVEVEWDLPDRVWNRDGECGIAGSAHGD